MLFPLFHWHSSNICRQATWLASVWTPYLNTFQSVRILPSLPHTFYLNLPRLVIIHSLWQTRLLFTQLWGGHAVGFAGETWPSNRKTAESSCAPWKTAPAAVLEHTDIWRHLAREMCTPVPVQDGVARVETWSFSGARTGTTILQDQKAYCTQGFLWFFCL